MSKMFGESISRPMIGISNKISVIIATTNPTPFKISYIYSSRANFADLGQRTTSKPLGSFYTIVRKQGASSVK